MANGIASEEMVIALGQKKILASFGAAGLPLPRLETAIHRIQKALPEGPYAFCLIHSPNEPALERGAVDLYLKHGIRTVEASAFLALTPHIVAYRVSGLFLDAQGQIQIQNRIIAKISRRETATRFMQPAPTKILTELVAQNRITEQQAKLAENVPMADDITVEADSGGHTDNRPLVCLIPSIQAIRDELQEQYGYEKQVRVGAAGGIGTPVSALGAFVMGAAYVVTGSVNQSCVEAGTSTHVKELLAQADMADVMMAPAADMFEMGVKLQVLKRGTLFPMRAQKLYDIYKNYNAIENIPTDERTKLEQQIFRKNLDEVWQETVAFFNERDPEQIQRASENPKRKMALIFRWYLGLSSHWANIGEQGREMDAQIWCGPAMGAFNDWVKNTYLAQPENRHVVDIAQHMITGALYLYRLQSLKCQGLQIPRSFEKYHPTPF
jgi:PfaD family protein